VTSPDPTPDTGLSTYAGNWVVDPARTTVSFQTKAMWLFPVKGTASVQEGSGSVSADGTVEGRLVIDATTIATGVTKRDQHLQDADFFDTGRFPTIEFQLTGARPLTPGRVALDGALTVHGRTEAVTVEADVSSDGGTATIDGTIEDLDRRKWDLTWTKMGAGVHNRISVHATITRS
jgi:polyisoprenoid-binding protein YceI